MAKMLDRRAFVTGMAIASALLFALHYLTAVTEDGYRYSDS